MRAIILAAGRGSRMGTLTGEQPKCLAMLAGRTLLDWQLQALKRAGITRIAIVRGYRGELLRRAGVEFFDNPRWADTNMVMSLACASDWLKNSECIVSYSDIVYTSTVVRRLAEVRADLAVSYDVNWLALWARRFPDPLQDAESFTTDGNGRLADIGSRVTSLDRIRGQYMGLLKFSPAGWQTAEQEIGASSPTVRDKLDMTSLLKRLLDKDVRVDTVACTEPWFEVDSAADLALYEELLKDPAQAGALAI